VKHIPYGYDEISNSMLDVVAVENDAQNHILYYNIFNSSWSSC